MGQSISGSFVWRSPDPSVAAGSEYVDVASEHKLSFAIETAGASDIPKRATSGAAGYDITANESLVLQPGERRLVSTGLKVAMDDINQTQFPGDTVVYGAIKGRSGLASKGIDVFNGTIDSDYRGEIKVLVINNNNASSPAHEIHPGDRIAQLVFCLALTPVLVGHDDVSERFKTERGDGGFGSTGE